MNWVWFNCRHTSLGISFQWKVRLKVCFKERRWADAHAPLRHKEAEGTLRWWGIYINSLNKSHLNNPSIKSFSKEEFGFLRPVRRSDQHRTQLSAFSSAPWFRQVNHALGRQPANLIIELLIYSILIFQNPRQIKIWQTLAARASDAQRIVNGAKVIQLPLGNFSNMHIKMCLNHNEYEIHVLENTIPFTTLIPHKSIFYKVCNFYSGPPPQWVKTPSPSSWQASMWNRVVSLGGKNKEKENNASGKADSLPWDISCPSSEPTVSPASWRQPCVPRGVAGYSAVTIQNKKKVFWRKAF